MILGLDIGTHGLKVNGKVHIKSLVSAEENILGTDLVLEYDNQKYVIGKGDFNSELNKSTRETFIPLLYAGIVLSTKDTFNQVVCGLPINQYNSNKEYLTKLINDNKIKTIKVNGKSKEIVITDFAIYPEGIGAYYSLDTNDDVIIVDIGGKTTDIAFICDKRNEISSTVPIGTLDIYKTIADKLNAEYSLALSITQVERIVTKGVLKIDNEPVDLSFITGILKENFMKIKEDLDLKFPSRTERIVLVGGGTKLFATAFLKRYKNCEVATDTIFANSIGFKKVGEELWG